MKKLGKAFYNVPNGTSLQKRPWKIQSHLYPLEILDAGIFVEVRALDGLHRNLLKLYKVDAAYSPIAKPLDFTLRSKLQKAYLNSNLAYKVSAKPLDLLLKSKLLYKYIDDKIYLKVNAKPLNFTLLNELVTHKVSDISTYSVSAKPKDFTLK